MELLLSSVEARARAHPEPYAHWYIDGGKQTEHSPLLTAVSYQALEPTRVALLKKMQFEIQKPGMGPEELRTHLARLTPTDLGMETADEVLNRFQIKMHTGGSRYADLQHHICPVDSPRGVTPGAILNVAGAICAAPTTEADE